MRGPSEFGDKRLITAAVFVSTFLVGLDAAIVSTAMPTVIGQIGGINLYAWVFSAYLLTSTVSVPIYGKLADLYGRKPLYLVSCSIFLVASLLAGQAQTMEQLILFRFVQGLGAGGIFPITQTIIGDVFPLEERARLQGAFSSVWGVAALVGPVIGGFFTEQISWRWAFYLNGPLVLLSMGIMAFALKERIVRRPHSIDYLGAALLAAAVTVLLLAFQMTDRTGPGIFPVWVLFVGAALLAVLFVWQERRATEPLVALALFKSRVISLGVLGSTVVGVILFGQSTFVAPYLQAVMGASPTVSGFVLAIASVSWPASSVLAGKSLIVWGYRRTALIGAGLLVVATLLLVRMQQADGLVYAAVALAILGGGFGFVLPLFTISMQNAVGWQQRGVVTSLSQFARTIGGSIGVSVAGGIFATSVTSQMGGADANQLLTEAGRALLPAAELARLQIVLASSLGSVYTLLAGMAVATVVITGFLPGGGAAEHVYQEESPSDATSGGEGPPSDAAHRDRESALTGSRR